MTVAEYMIQIIEQKYEIDDAEESTTLRLAFDDQLGLELFINDLEMELDTDLPKEKLMALPETATVKDFLDTLAAAGIQNVRAKAA